MAVSSNPSHGTPKTEHATTNRPLGETKAHDLADKARSTAGNVADKARETASNVADKARETASNLTDKARDTASHLSERAGDALSNVGSTMTSLADQLHESAPREGMLGTAASTVADNLRAGGRYLQEHDLGDIGEDATRLVRRYPMQSILCAFGIGCLMGLTFSRR